MPCRYDPLEDEVVSVRVELDRVTRMLCGLCRVLEEVGTDPLYSVPELLGWWRAHKQMDDARVARERAEAEKQRLRQQAIQKLTAAECEALGIK